MKVRAKTNVNAGGVWYGAGDVFETDDIGGLKGLVEAEQEEPVKAPAPPEPAPEEKPKRTSRRKTGK